MKEGSDSVSTALERNQIILDQITTHRNRAIAAAKKMDSAAFPIVEYLSSIINALEVAGLDDEVEKARKVAMTFADSLEEVGEIFGLLFQDMANLTQSQVEQLTELREMFDKENKK